MTENKTVMIGEDVTLSCLYITGAPARVSWLKHYMVNGSYVDENKIAFVTTLKVFVDSIAFTRDLNYSDDPSSRLAICFENLFASQCL